MIPLAHNHSANSSIHLNPTPKTQPTCSKNLPQQNISFINHSKIGFQDSSSGLELWKFYININNPKFLKVPPNVTSRMDWSGDASLGHKISMTPIHVHSLCIGLLYLCGLVLMHMESQPGWPALDLS
ncbi:hypothetical protein O181_053915 [Austropuccinia psidii MF-1]|uniref:Uncharacterized protein n=1 Tax=Austropuccinia psidii MF-1 TaxID=1389203 RepID=A0A9Q3E1F9_9BASI|nr:hypothetical protein [Austropuccinia psidii MF-1]